MGLLVVLHFGLHLRLALGKSAPDLLVVALLIAAREVGVGAGAGQGGIARTLAILSSCHCKYGVSKSLINISCCDGDVLYCIL